MCWNTDEAPGPDLWEGKVDIYPGASSNWGFPQSWAVRPQVKAGLTYLISIIIK